MYTCEYEIDWNKMCSVELLHSWDQCLMQLVSYQFTLQLMAQHPSFPGFEEDLPCSVTPKSESLSRPIFIAHQGYDFTGNIRDADIQLDYPTPGGRLNKKDGLTRYGNSHVKDKTS